MMPISIFYSRQGSPFVKISTFAAFCSLTLFSYGQSLPKEFYFSSDGHILHIGGKPTTGIYDEGVIQQINLQFSQGNYWTQLTNNYASKTDLAATMTVNGVKYENVGVRFKGQTSYQGARNADKKSFNLSTDFINTAQKVGGYKTFNLNNSYQDASFMREVFYYHQIRRHTPAAKANFVHLYLNGQDWGLYQSIQQLNKDFLKEWFFSNDGSNWRAESPTGMGGGFGNGTSALNYFTDDTTTYQKYYTLKSSDQKYPWKDLPTLCRLLNKTELDKLEETVAQYLDIDRTLWHIANEVLFSDDDSYIHKGGMDYYLYQDAETGRFMTMDYDGNSVMATQNATWSPFYNETKINFPVMNRLFAVPTIRQRYLAHLRTLINETFDEKTTSATIDKYASLIDSLVLKDPKKMTSYAQFQNAIPALKSFISTRRNYLLNNIEVKEASPNITETAFYTNNIAWQTPTADEEVTIRTKVTSTAGISKVVLYYGLGLYGRFIKLDMFDDGKHNDGYANDGLYATQIPKYSAATWVRFYVEATASNPTKSVSYAPVGAEHDVFVYQVKGQGTGTTNPITPQPIVTGVYPALVKKILLQPNPASQRVWMKLNGFNHAPIFVYNLLGQVVYQCNYEEEIHLSLQNWKPGLYFVRCGDITEKLVVY